VRGLSQEDRVPVFFGSLDGDFQWIARSLLLILLRYTP
jgi:hypothetical protein